jgi:hypothetical protein
MEPGPRLLAFISMGMLLFFWVSKIDTAAESPRPASKEDELSGIDTPFGE